METQFIKLNMIPSGVNPCFHISQYDIGRSLGFIIYNGSEVVDLDSYTCTIEATRSDGVAITASVATDDNIGTFETTATMTNKADKYKAQFVIVDGDSNRIASLPFDMDVCKAAMDENSESIEEDASLYQQYTEAVQGAIAEANADIQAEENARIAAVSAEENARTAAVSAEATARANADTTLQNNIDAEATARANADTAEATARQNADATLQGNINSEASTRASADSNLQSQINQIVAPSGEAPSASEVQNARVGANGVTYNTLGDAIRTNDNESFKSINEGSVQVGRRIISANGNYLDLNDLTLEGFFANSTGNFNSNSDFRCGYVAIPFPGTFRIRQRKNIFGENASKVCLFSPLKTYVKTLSCTKIDDNTYEFTITENDFTRIKYVGASYPISDSKYTMLTYGIDYTTSKSYVAPDYAVTGKSTLRCKSVGSTLDLTEFDETGFYQIDNLSNAVDKPSEYIGSSGLLEVVSPGLTDNYCVQILYSPSNPPRMFWRYVNISSHEGGVWAQALRTANYEADMQLINANAPLYAPDQVALNGNYFNNDTAIWEEGGIDGATGHKYILAGFYFSFCPLPGAGDYIRVCKKDTYGNNAVNIALFDALKKYVKTIQGTSSDNMHYSFTVSEEDFKTCKYVVMQKSDSETWLPKLFYKTTPHLSAYTKQEANFGFINHPLYNKIVVCNGDSIGHAVGDTKKDGKIAGWFGRLVNGFKCSGYNYCVGGGTITYGLYYQGGDMRHCICDTIDDMYNEYPNADFVILEGGTNDADLIGRFNGDTPPVKFGAWSLDDFTGNYDKETFCGAVDYMFYQAVRLFPKAKIGFIIAMEMGTSTASINNRRRYFDEIAKIAEKWHVSVLDLWKNCHADARLSVYWDSTKTSTENSDAGNFYLDGQHPTWAGYDLMQPMIEQWMISL